MVLEPAFIIDTVPHGGMCKPTACHADLRHDPLRPATPSKTKQGRLGGRRTPQQAREESIPSFANCKAKGTPMLKTLVRECWLQCGLIQGVRKGLTRLFLPQKQLPLRLIDLELIISNQVSFQVSDIYIIPSQFVGF